MTRSVSAHRVLPLALRAPAAVLGVVGAVSTAVLGALLAGGTAPSPADGWVPLAENGWRQVALVVDFGGEPVGAALLVLALATTCLLAGHRRAAVLAVAGPAGAVAVTMVLKPLAGRTIHGPENLSYPSGHTALATAVSVVFALLIIDQLSVRPGAAVVLVLVAAVLAGAIMGWSQVALGAHYETDTVGGFGAAVAVAPGVAWVLDRVGDRRQAA